MSNFTCPHCGTAIYDSPRGYVTGCVHYPAEVPVSVYDCTTYRDEEQWQRRFVVIGCGSALEAMKYLPQAGKMFDGKLVNDIRVEQLVSEPHSWLAIVKQSFGLMRAEEE